MTCGTPSFMTLIRRVVDTLTKGGFIRVEKKKNGRVEKKKDSVSLTRSGRKLVTEAGPEIPTT
jgi:DNA-binding MarR family transcriptional regulator